MLFASAYLFLLSLRVSHTADGDDVEAKLQYVDDEIDYKDPCKAGKSIWSPLSVSDVFLFIYLFFWS